MSSNGLFCQEGLLKSLRDGSFKHRIGRLQGMDRGKLDGEKKARYWRQTLGEAARSGMLIRKYCRRRRLKESLAVDQLVSFENWQEDGNGMA